MVVLKKSNAPLAARWDKLKSWKSLTDDIHSKINSLEKEDEAITLDIGPQLLHTLRHPSSLRCIDHSSSKLGEMFSTHYNKGAVQSVKVWTLESKDKNGILKQKSFETDCEMTTMTYVSKHRAYLVFCTDLTLRVFTDAHSNFVEVQCIPCLSTILCLIYNKEDDEIYAGGIGFIEEWKVQGAEHAATAMPGRKFYTELTRNEWIRDIKLDRHNNQMFAVHGNGISVISLKTRRQLQKLPNRHDGPLKCSCYYQQSDFLVTGGSDGKIKLFNGTAFNLLHVLTGHTGPITSVQSHKTDTLLFSSSLDGTIRIWRMDSLQMFMRLDVGERITRLSLMGSTEFFFHTEKNILIYSLNQFYQLFAPVESETKKLMRCQGRGKCSRILGSTEDGSVRLFSPVTGLTLTIVYPMPSFQVLMSFAYDMHQDKLHTVLTEGSVLVYDTATNPCTAEEVWVPACDDEQVNNLLIVTVEFMCSDGGLDIDNLVFAGLKNGQIILCEAVVCSLQNPVQAHEGYIICLERCLQMTQRNMCQLDTSNMIISGGTDNFVKIWFIEVNTDGNRPVVNLMQMLKIFLVSIPTHISMFGSQISVVIKAHTKLGVRWRLIMYHLVSKDAEIKGICNMLSMASMVPYQLTHCPDEDHCMELTSLDVCPIMGVILTAGQDGFVKIWNNKNELLREMNFVNPVYASCFANDRGDILVGYGPHICSVSVVNYLPLSYLRRVLYISEIARLQDDKRELPVKFDHKSQPWLDLEKIHKYSINIFDRRRQHLEEEVIERLKREKEAATKFVIFVDGGTTKVISKDLADRLLHWAKGKNKLGIGKKALSEFTSLSDITEVKESKKVEKKQTTDIKKDEPSTIHEESVLIEEAEEKEYLDSQCLIEIYPSAVGKAIHSLESKKHLSPYEMRLLSEAELLKKDPIIAPDGYIPNSVIRRKLKPPKVDPPKRVERPFKLKPVPKINPDHLPSWWGKDEEKEPTTPVRYRVMKWEDSPSPTSHISSVSTVSIKSLVESPVKRYIEDKSKTTTPITPKEKQGSKTPGKQSSNDKTPVENVKKMIKLNEKYSKKSGWEDSTSSEKPDTATGLSQPSSARDDLRRSPTDLSESSTRLKSGNKLKPGTPTYKLKSKRIELSRIDVEMTTPDSVRRRRKSGGRSVERTKSFKLTSLAVDEDSSMIHIKETKSGRRVKNNLNSEIIQQLLEEKWMPKMEGSFEYEDVLDTLIGTLDNGNPVVYDDVCKYLTNIFRELGIPEAQLEQTLGKLGINLNNINSAIKKYTLRTLQTLGEGRNDVLLLILPKLVDQEEPIRRAAAEAIEVLTGAQDKDQLLNILDEMGITGGLYSSKEDEALALQMLAERFDNKDDDSQYFDRIQDWVQGTTPGLYEDEKEDDTLWQDGTRSRKSIQGKELSFMSDGKSVIDIFDNSGPSGRNTMYADLPATPPFSSDDEFAFESRVVSMEEGKSTGLKSEKSHYKARMDLLDRTGASVFPSERVEQATPISDEENDYFMENPIEEGQESPFMADPLFALEKSKSNMSNGTRPTSQRSHDLLLGERTLTELSQVGPLPKFLSNDLTKQNTDNISTDSAFESTFTTSDYATSHYSEKLTMSHVDQHSSKQSEMSDETNNMFDVEQISNLEYEGEEDAANSDINRMKKHELSLTVDSKSNSMVESEEEEMYPQGISVEITPRDSGRKDSQDTPQSGSTFKKKLQEMDGFSTISDRSSLSRKSKRSASSRTGSKLTHHTQDFDADNEDDTVSEPVMSVKIRTPVSHVSVPQGNQSQTPDAVSLRDILAYKSGNQTPASSDRHTLGTGQKNCPNAEGSVSIRPGTTDLTSNKYKEEFTESQYVHQFTITDATETTTTDPHQDTYDNLTIDLMAHQNAQYSNDDIKGTPEHESPAYLNNVIQEPVDDETHEGQMETTKVSRMGSSGTRKGDEGIDESLKEVLSLPIKDVPVDPSGSTDSVSPRTLVSRMNTSPIPLNVTEETPGGRKRVPEPERVVKPDRGSTNTNRDRFTPRDPYLYKYYDKQQEQVTGGDKQTGGTHEEDESAEKASGDTDDKLQLTEKDSDFHTISNVASSQITDRLSGQDSGIARDMSEFSQGKPGVIKEHATEKGYMYRAPLSPVKSEASSKGRHSARSIKSPKEWRKFFDELPNAAERRQMEQIKKEMEQGKLKASTLPPISYFADDIPMLPGEAGTRLLQTVQVSEKLPQGTDLRHRIESVPGKLAVHTQNEDGGFSHFGILQMKWTTGVPTVKDKLHPPQRIPQYRSPVTKSHDSYLLSMPSLHRLNNEISEEELNLPPLSARSPAVTHPQSLSHYEWELPLPPPPAKESRTNIPTLKKDHDSYCKYYELVKKKLHLYTSQKRERTLNLPEVLAVKRIREPPTGNSGPPRKPLSPSKTAVGSQLFLPPIKLGQLVKIY